MTLQKVTSSIIQESNYSFKSENKKLQNDTDKDNKFLFYRMFFTEFAAFFNENRSK